jgi:hypothetical protein
VLELNKIERIRVIFAQKAASSLHYRDSENNQADETHAFHFSEQP